jgi:hypothetical protein
VFDAYLDVYQASIADLLRIATGGSGVLPPGRLHPDLVSRVADEAVKSADRLLGMVVRAFDYLPVVDVTFGDVVRAIVTADRVLFPDDSGNLRGTLVEAMRRRGIYPPRVSSLADAALTWPAPAQPLSLADPAAPVDLQPLILSATRDLDLTGEAGAVTSTRPAGDGDAPAGKSFYEQVERWARRHAYALGLEPSVPIALAGVHVAYRQAADRQPRPEIVVQLTQRRKDLEDQGLDQNKRPVFRAGTTLIAGVDGRVEFTIAKPFPFVDPDAVAALPPGHVAHDLHRAGSDRLAAVRRWLEGLEEDDARSAWTLEPAIDRLDFAAMHNDSGEGDG